MVKKNIFKNLYAIKSYISAHQGGIIWHTIICKNIPGVYFCRGYIFDCYTGHQTWIAHPRGKHDTIALLPLQLLYAWKLLILMRIKVHLYTCVGNSDSLDGYTSNICILARHKWKRFITEVKWGQHGQHITWFRSSQSQHSCVVGGVDELDITSPFKSVLFHPSVIDQIEPSLRYSSHLFMNKVESHNKIS